MLATVLRGELAEQQSIFIMRTFREMRHYIKQNQQFVTRSEMELLSSKVTEISVQTAGLIDKQKQTDQKVDLIQKNVEQLSENFISEKDVKNFVIYKGQKLEADIAYIEIYQQAKKSIYVVDDYMNAKSLQHLSQKTDGVEVVLFTENGNKLYLNLQGYGLEGEKESAWFVDGIKKYHRMFSTIINTLTKTGFVVEKLIEPLPDEALLEKYPEYNDLFHKPDFLIVRARKS